MINQSCLKGLLILICTLFYNNVDAKIKLPVLVGDNMVLQQKTKVEFWGEASSNKQVSLFIPWLKDKIKTRADDKGQWRVVIETPQAGGPYDIRITDGDEVVIRNVYIGEVWICSGQSNMEMPVKGFFSQPVAESNQTISEADPSVPIHMFTVQRDASKVLKDDVKGAWEINTGEAVSNFSAAAYFFGKQLYSVLRIPIGLISTSWGASNIESWMPTELLKEKFPTVSLNHLTNDVAVKVPQQAASLLHNGMLYPLRKYKCKGMIWYQGEANRFRPAEYEKLFVSFIEYVRDMFEYKEMPFYYAQIAPFRYKDKDEPLSGALLREIQLNCEKKLTHVGMAVLTDVGDEFIIHPAQKKVVGNRLAYWALKNEYNNKGVSAQSPRFLSQKVQGNKIVLSFEHADMGLTSFGKPLQCFEIAGEDQVFHKAKAVINGNKVVVWSENVMEPVAVRYAFKNFVIGDLFGTNGLPVSSFRTAF